jgi:hypothetical protein
MRVAGDSRNENVLFSPRIALTIKFPQLIAATCIYLISFAEKYREFENPLIRGVHPMEAKKALQLPQEVVQLCNVEVRAVRK